MTLGILPPLRVVHAARTLFLRLIKIGDGAEDTRRRVARADLLRGLDPGGVSPVVDAFTQGRLLTQDQDTVECDVLSLVGVCVVAGAVAGWPVRGRCCL